jgi:hypothetical protein
MTTSSLRRLWENFVANLLTTIVVAALAFLLQSGPAGPANECKPIDTRHFDVLQSGGK